MYAVNLLRRLLKRVITSANLSSYSNFEDKKKVILLQVFSYLFLVLMLGFISYNAAVGDYDYLIVNSCSLLFGGVLYYLFKEKQALKFVTMFFVITIMAVTTYFVQTGGVEQTGMYFAILIPLPAILLVGRQKGSILVGAFVALNLLFYLLFSGLDWYPHYSVSSAGRLVLVFFLITAVAYINEFAFEFLYIRIQKLSESLIQSQQDYKNLAANKEQFLSLVSNNLSDHIGSFAAISNLLNDEYDNLTDEQKRELVRNLASFSEQNHRVVNDLMRWSTAQTGVMNYEPQVLKLEKVYRDVVELFSPLIEEKDLSFFLKMKSNSELFADADMAGAILRILVSNAIKFSNPGGEVSISAEEVGDYMQIKVKDNGMGISEENLIRINSSVAFSTPGTNEEPGSGIGLILAKDFLAKNNGTFKAESKRGKGTTITFTLPLVD